MPERFAYPFEAPLAEIAREIESLRAEGGGQGAEERLARLRQRFDETAKRIVSTLTPYQRVMLARHPERPQSLDFIAAIADDFIELHGDRCVGDDKAIVCGLGAISGRRMAIVAQQKGRDTKERLARNFGMVRPEGFRKALRIMRLAEKFSLPVLTLIDTKGAAADLEAEQRGEGFAIAQSLAAMSALRTPILSVVIGEGCSGGALGIGVCDWCGMLENAYYCVITPEGCAAILYRDAEKAPEAAAAMKITAQELVALGVADEVVAEPPGGAHWDPAAAANALKAAVLRNLERLASIPPEELIKARRSRYRRLGAFLEGEAAAAEAARRKADFGSGQATPTGGD